MIKIEDLVKFTKELLGKEIEIQYKDKTDEGNIIKKKILITKEKLYLIWFDKNKNPIFWFEIEELENRLLTITINVKEKNKESANRMIKELEENINKITTVESLFNFKV